MDHPPETTKSGRYTTDECCSGDRYMVIEDVPAKPEVDLDTETVQVLMEDRISTGG